jgi:hypothetical protein
MKQYIDYATFEEIGAGYYAIGGFASNAEFSETKRIVNKWLDDWRETVSRLSGVELVGCYTAPALYSTLAYKLVFYVPDMEYLTILAKYHTPESPERYRRTKRAGMLHACKIFNCAFGGDPTPYLANPYHIMGVDIEKFEKLGLDVYDVRYRLDTKYASCSPIVALLNDDRRKWSIPIQRYLYESYVENLAFDNHIIITNFIAELLKNKDKYIDSQHEHIIVIHNFAVALYRFGGLK